MRINGDATLTDAGVQIEPSQAALLGLSDGCRCWGLWLDSKRGRDLFVSGGDEPEEEDELSPERASSPTTAERQFPHLIVSPLHPDAWLSAFRLEAYLDRSYQCKDSAANPFAAPLNSIPQFTEAIKSLGINTVSAEGGIAGYDLFVLSAVCEVPAIKRVMIRESAAFLDRLCGLVEQARGEDASARATALRDMNGLRVEWFRRTGLTMVPTLAAIAANIRLDHQHGYEMIGDEIEEKHTRRPYLNRHVVQHGPTPWFLEWREHFRGFTPETMMERLAGLTFLGVGDWEELTDRLRQMFIAQQPSVVKQLGGIAEVSSVEAAHAIELPSGMFAMRPIYESLAAHAIRPVSCRALLALAYARVWSFPEEAPVEFEYDEGSHTLRLARPGCVRDFLNRFIVGDNIFQKDEGDAVITSLHPHDCYMRMRFVRRNMARKSFWAIELTYRATARTAPVDSKGILEAVLRACIFAHKLRVERIVTRPIVNTGTVESSRITVLVKQVLSAADEGGPGDGVDWPALERTIRAEVELAMAKPGAPSQVEILSLVGRAWATTAS